jgi:hypothetical protein
MQLKTATSFTPSSFRPGKLKVRLPQLDMTEREAEYTLVMDMNAFARGLEVLQLDLTDPGSWQGLSSVQIAKILWCSLHRFHPQVTIDEALGFVPMQHSAQLWMMLIEMVFPGVVEEIAKKVREKQDQEGQQLAGEKQPNADAALNPS